ncbi:metal-dependent phosphohydrolase [Nocardiopsis dassonvillei]|uniref:HD domain-containing protein n=1 Tax=Nocardiopsis dassonvillei TaxID=2014 RepID=UPI0008FC5928|nr:metal-dependent phosphohydrolase [Nocardiopsis dassonvillei]
MTLEQASRLAEEAHAGQVDRAGRPYAEHVFAVRDLLAGHGERAQAAGVLHDVLEDTPITADDLRARGCPEEVVRAVESVTRRPGEPYEEMVRRAAADPLGRLVKLADNAHNSDERRLALLSDERARRLRAKYARARRILEEGPQEDGLPEAALPRGTLLVLHTGRVEECRAFYTGLGLRFVRERHGSGPEHHAAELDGGAVVEIYPATAERSTGAARLGFTVRGDRAVPPLEPGRRVLTDPDGRKVDLRVV